MYRKTFLASLAAILSAMYAQAGEVPKQQTASMMVYFIDGEDCPEAARPVFTEDGEILREAATRVRVIEAG